MTRVFALCLLCLAACEEADAGSAWTEDQAAINADELVSLEQRVATLEEENERMRDDLMSVVGAAASDLDGVQSEIERLSDNDTGLQDNIDYLGRYHGVPPAPRR